MRAIKEELGDTDEDEDDIVALDRKLQSSGMPGNVWKHTQRELRYVAVLSIMKEFHILSIMYNIISL